MDPSGLQNWHSLFFFYKTLELAKEWSSSELWNWRRMGDFRISETNTYEFLLEILADYTIRRFVSSNVFGSGLVQVCLAWSFKIKRYSLDSFRYWISFHYSKDPKRQNGSVTPSFQTVGWFR
ncbi:unnamed protein product [Rhizophagus irregularis]|nr:unnamed protein product [Rhizophagus irregularis]